MTYNIIENPIMFVYRKDNSHEQLSIRDILNQTENIVSISGDTPLQEFPLTRLLVAILYGALTEELSTEEEWFSLWEKGFPTNKINDYLNKYKHRFEMFDTDTPFYQIVGAKYQKEKAEISNFPLTVDMQKITIKQKIPRFHFSSASLEGINKLPYDVATRKLIELQNYRTASRQSVLVGEPRVKKIYYAQQGWLGNFTGILLQGENLKETLLLNAPPYENYSNVNKYKDLAVWEKPQQTVSPERFVGDLEEYGIMKGPREALTSQIARVSLVKGKTNTVIGSIVGIGDRIFKYNQLHSEPMATWSKIKRESGEEAFVPIKTNVPEIWLGLVSIFAMVEGKEQKLALNLAFYRANSWRLNKTTAKIKTFEIDYGAQDAIINEMNVSSLSLPASLLQEGNEDALARVIEAAQEAKNVAKIVANLQADIFVSEGKIRKPPKGISVYDMAQSVREQFLFTVGYEFTLWLHTVTAKNFNTKYNNWLITLKTLACSFKEELTRSPSPRSIRGSKEADKIFTIFHAINRFNLNLSKELKNV